MQVSGVDKLEDHRDYRSIGRMKACSCWRGVNAPTPEADRLEAVQALIREAEDYDADAIIGLDFEIDTVAAVDIGATPLRRIAATGVAIKFSEVSATAASTRTED
jgi:hypothetical protein